MISVLSDIFICGNFKIYLLKINLTNDVASCFYNTMSSISFMTVITRPTCIADTSCSHINIIFLSIYGKSKPSLLTICSTDHLPIFLSLHHIFKVLMYC